MSEICLLNVCLSCSSDHIAPILSSPSFLISVFPALFFYLQTVSTPPLLFLGNCFYFPFCASVGNSSFPVILLVGWLSVDFVQTVGSALREGLVLDLQSLLIILSSFKQPIDNRLSLSATPATHKAIHWDIVVVFYGEGSLPLLCGLIVLERDFFSLFNFSEENHSYFIDPS